MFSDPLNYKLLGGREIKESSVLSKINEKTTKIRQARQILSKSLSTDTCWKKSVQYMIDRHILCNSCQKQTNKPSKYYAVLNTNSWHKIL